MNKELELKKSLKDNGIDENYYNYLFKYLEDKDKIEEAVFELINGKPIQYIIGNVDFYNSVIKVNENVLIPRYETELLVEKLVKYIKNKFNEKIDILDMCTGSGCIAISLKKEINCNVDAVDISADALVVAKENSVYNNTEVNFIESDLFTNVNKKYDVIVSNPPYIAYSEDIMSLVKDNEPNIALYADDNGLYFYKKIISNIKKYLKDNFIVAFEIGMTQGNEIKNIINDNISNCEVVIEKDYNDRDRFVFIFKK